MMGDRTQMLISFVKVKDFEPQTFTWTSSLDSLAHIFELKVMYIRIRHNVWTKLTDRAFTFNKILKPY